MILCCIFILFIGINQIIGSKKKSDTTNSESLDGFISDLTDIQYDRIFTDENYIPFPQSDVLVDENININTQSGKIYSLDGRLIIELKEDHNDIDISTINRLIKQLGIDPENSIVEWR